jgi:hypothetical protein
MSPVHGLLEEHSPLYPDDGDEEVSAGDTAVVLAGGATYTGDGVATGTGLEDVEY